jgi:tetratricopeptide (TPR) repeat protein
MVPDLPDLDQQITLFEQRLAADPGGRAFLPLADLYRRDGRLADARRVLERGLEAHPDLVAARAALGRVLVELGDSDAARGALRRVLAADRDNLVALRLLAGDAGERGQWPEACELYERLLRLEPDDAAVRDGLLEARRAVDEPTPGAPPAADATPVVDRPAARPTSPSPMGGFETPTLAELYLRQGHLDKARDILERILAHDPDRQDALAIMERLADAPPAASLPAATSSASASASASPSAADDDRPASGRDADLDRFRTWLDGAGDPSSPAN